MDKKRMEMIVFSVIANAGEAMDYYHQALEKAKKYEFKESEVLLNKGHESLNVAHKSQTDLLVVEANKGELSYSPIMVHAQDHLMNAMLFRMIVKEFIELYRLRKEDSEK
ncbi:MAG: PTS lactose/cellobiose transporter subunit IIA [Tepidanaerobacteraceae bacterium]|nr:PTS lactose/cellobiose transporter subunit IIA [Tepidanaerobacteraceae bacterium]